MTWRWWKVAVNTVSRLLRRQRHSLPRALAQPRRWRLRIPARGSLPPAGAEPVVGDDLESAIKAEREVARAAVYAALERRVLPALLPCVACKGAFSLRLQLDSYALRWIASRWTCDLCGEELTAAQIDERVGDTAWRYRYRLPRVKAVYPAHVYWDGL